MTILFYIETAFTLLFSLLVIVKNFGTVQVLASLFGTLYSLWLFICTYKFLKKQTQKTWIFLRKTIEYIPYVFIVTFVISRTQNINSSGLEIMDAILSLTWLVILLISIFLLFRLNEKRLKNYFPQIKFPEQTKKRFFIFEILDWLDAFLQAAFIVVIFTIFVFQLYVIPSESMVPEFMIGDRVAGIKFLSGPTFPLSSFRFPQIQKYKRGDVVILRNPHYENDPNNELKFFASQLIQYLTLTTVNINTDSLGNIKADPLVKRIVAVAGEKVMLVDGVLYIKKAGEQDFKPFDESSYAAWNLSTLPQSQRKYVQNIDRMTTEKLNRLQSVEALRADLDFNKAKIECNNLIEKMKQIKGKSDTVFSANNFLAKGQYLITQLVKDNESISSKILTTNGGLMWFKNFLTTKSEEEFANYNLYEKRNAQLNTLIKIAYGKLFIRNAELYKANTSSEKFANDEVRTNLLGELNEYLFYLAYTSQRNMNEFPAGKEDYIPEDHYFMMGDNRFNSIDMRHEYVYHLEKLDEMDELSVLFITNIKPRALPSSKMLGTVNFILYPFSRFGKIK